MNDWTSSEWLAEARAWLDEQLAAAGVELVAELDLACWNGKVARALVWERSLHGDLGDLARVPLEILATLRMNSWHGPALEPLLGSGSP